MKAYGEFMPTLDDLHEADKQHASALAALEARVTGHDVMLQAINTHLSKQGEEIGRIRETLGGLATKADILNLGQQIAGFNQQQLMAAHNSIPSKIAAYAGVGMFLLTLAAFAISHFK